MPYQAGYAIADIAALKALSSADLVNGYVRWVISKNTWYGWDLESTALANDDTVVAINSAPLTGRFIDSKGRLAINNQYNIQSEILRDTPIGYWKLDELSGTIAQNFGSGMSNGSYTGVGLGQLGLADGSDYSASFDGINSRISFANILLDGNSDISLESIVKLSSTNLKGSFIKLGIGNDAGIGFGVGGSTQDDLGNNLIGIAEGAAWKPTTIKIGTGTHHVGLVYKGSTTKEWLYYLDGFLVSTLSSQMIQSPNNLGLIGSGDNNRYINSIIDEVAIYNKALPAVRWLSHANTVIY